MHPLTLGLAAAVLAVGAIVQASVGFGSMLVAAPLLALLDARLIPGPALVAGLVLVTLVVAREHHAIDREGLPWIVGGLAPGTVAGGLLVGVLHGDALRVALGAVLLAATLIAALVPGVGRSAGALFASGAASGLMGTATSVGGPLLALVYQHAEAPVVRSTLNAIFALADVLGIATLIAVGRFGWQEVGWGLALAPGMAAGFAASRWVTPHLDGRALRPALLLVSLASALAVLVSAVM